MAKTFGYPMNTPQQLGVRSYMTYFVIVFLNKAAQSEPEPLVRPHRPVHGVQRPWCLVSRNITQFV